MSYRTRVYRQRNAQPPDVMQNEPFFTAKEGTKTTTSSFFQIQRQITDPIPEAKNQFYGHGAFMGAAPQLMADAKWNRILKALMPDVHADVTKALSGGPNSEDIILMMENNPVMAAYGMYQTKQMDVRKEGGREDRIAKMEAIEWDAWLPPSTVEAYKKSTSEAEKKRLAHEMVGDMLIAHGTGGQTYLENRWDRRQYEDVKETRKSGQGGVRPGAWMDLFGRALMLATANNWEEKAKEFEDPKLHPRVNSPDDQAANQTFQNQLPFKDVINLYKNVIGKDTFSVLLDIKSRDATTDVLRGVVEDLNLRGVLVYGVGSFVHGEILGLSANSQVVDGKTYSGPREIKFFHLAGDLQNACLENKINKADKVMFNAGSLISSSFKVKTDVVAQLNKYKQYYGFNLGVYVQENDLDSRAAASITTLTNNRPDIFDLGFAWGGLSGQAASDIEPRWSSQAIGIGLQGLAGEYWNVEKPYPSLTPVGSSGFTSTIRMQYRYMESRRFAVNNGAVNVICDASWNQNGCEPHTYFITLVKEKRLWWDKEQGTMGFPAGERHGATWEGLDSGDYYLEIWMSDHDPRCILSGNIKVST